jgi:hypothetical protein
MIDGAPIPRLLHRALDTITRIMPELALDHHERYAFVSERDGVRMAQLVWGKAAADAGGRGAVT